MTVSSPPKFIAAPGEDHMIFAWTSHWARDFRLKLWAAQETGSTNTIAKNDSDPHTTPWLTDEVLEASKPSLYLARKQTQGRGRGSHSWITPEGCALLSTWSFAVARVPQPIFAPLTGLALFEAAHEIWADVPFNLKAPNDLFIGDKKVAGLLIETIDQGAHKRTVIGLGLNVTNPPRDVPTATSLAGHASEMITEGKWRAFLGLWLTNLESAIRAGQKNILSKDSCERLKTALNRHPLLKEPITHVDEIGQLHTPSRVIAWHEL